MKLFSRPRRSPRDAEALERVHQRLDRLEAMIEGLQDAVYRESRRHDVRIEELQERTGPGEMGKALSDDARRRGL
jgi:hypothetical protein